MTCRSPRRDTTTLPRPFEAIGTVVARSQGHSGSRAIDLLGIDRATFARAVGWRDDASERSLEELIDAIGAATEGPAPAIVIGGPLPDTRLESLIGQSMEVEPVETARWFPGLRNGAILVVVDKEKLTAAGFGAASEIWLHDPPPDALAQLSSAGIIVRSPRDLSQVFNVTSFLTVRWAYATLSILGVLVGIVVLLAQLLVLDARRQTRQAAHVLTTRMGLTMRGEAIGLVAELGPALASGAALGVLLGWLVTRVSISRLDSLRHLAPPARLASQPSAALPILVGGRRFARRACCGRPRHDQTHTAMEVMRGTA